MSEGEKPDGMVPESRLRESGKPPAGGESENNMDRRTVLRIGVTTAMATGAVALGIGLRAPHDGR